MVRPKNRGAPSGVIREDRLHGHKGFGIDWVGLVFSTDDVTACADIEANVAAVKWIDSDVFVWQVLEARENDGLHQIYF